MSFHFWPPDWRPFFFLMPLLVLLGCKNEPVKDLSTLDIQLGPTFASPEFLVQSFINAMNREAPEEVLNHVLNHGEYILAYPFLPGSDTSEHSRKAISSIYSASNRKEAPRWMDYWKEKQLEFKEFEIGTDTLFTEKYWLIKGNKIFAEAPDGEIEKVEIFNTLIRNKNGYKIWSLLET